MSYRPMAVAVLVAAAILAAYLPPHPPLPPVYYRGGWDDYPTPEARRAARLGEEFRVASGRAETRRLRDSAMHIVATHPARQGAGIAYGSNPRLDSVARALLHGGTPVLPALSREVRIGFLVIAAPTYSSYERLYLPQATDGRTCIVTVTVDTAGWGAIPRYLRPGDALGPCAFFAAFGLPGPFVGRWLESRSYDVAAKPDWTLRPHAPAPIEKTTAAVWFQGMLARLGGAPRASAEYLGYGGLYWESASVVGCAAGKVSACRRYVFSSLEAERRVAIPGVVAGEPYFDYASTRLLATLVREQGPGRFARFWRSPLPPEEAFDAAFTVPFAVWAPAWARATIGPVDVGASTRPRTALSSLLWIGLSVAGCAGLALVRRVA